MYQPYKPDGYNSVSPYLIVNGAQKILDLLKKIFNASELRRYGMPDGKIVHAEVKVDDSVIMMADATEMYPPNQLLIHVYVRDSDSVYKGALDAGCEAVQAPREHEGDPDRRGIFKDFAGNLWSVSTQLKK
ncbi:MAG: VOC family protein [Cyclobacteriaceae bacterium]